MIQTEFETTKTPLTEGKTKIIWGIDGNFYHPRNYES